MEPFQFRRREMVSIGSAHIERTFKDALPLTDAVWPSEDEIFCLRRGPDGVELLLVAEDKPLVVYQASRVLQLMAQGHAGLFLNTGQQLIRWTHVGCDAVYEHPAGIVSVAICESGAVACVVGERPGHWRAVVVDPRRSSSQVLEAERVLHLLWVGDTLVLVCAERRQGIDGVVFRLWKEGEGLRTLFRTGLTIRAVATAHKGKIAVAGGLLGGAQQGVWVFDPKNAPPYEAIVDIVPAGWAAFIASETVVFGSLPIHGNRLIVAEPNQVRSLALEQPSPRQIVAAPSGTRIAWARPDSSGGHLSICRLPP